MNSFVPTCKICGKPVPLKDCKTDGDGQAIHERCYVDKLKKDTGVLKTEDRPETKTRPPQR